MTTTYTIAHFGLPHPQPTDPTAVVKRTQMKETSQSTNEATRHGGDDTDRVLWLVNRMMKITSSAGGRVIGEHEERRGGRRIIRTR